VSLKDYIPGVVVAIVTAFEAVLTCAFIVSNQRIPGDAAFSLTTISISSIATLFGLGAFILSLPKIKESLRDKGISSNIYAIIAGGLLFLSVALAIAAIHLGSIEYTQFQSM